MLIIIENYDFYTQLPLG